MTKERRVKFTLFIAGKNIDRAHTQRAHILCDTLT
jgi:hypothetical protein